MKEKTITKLNSEFRKKMTEFGLNLKISREGNKITLSDDQAQNYRRKEILELSFNVVGETLYILKINEKGAGFKVNTMLNAFDYIYQYSKLKGVKSIEMEEKIFDSTAFSFVNKIRKKDIGFLNLLGFEGTEEEENDEKVKKMNLNVDKYVSLSQQYKSVKKKIEILSEENPTLVIQEITERKGKECFYLGDIRWKGYNSKFEVLFKNNNFIIIDENMENLENNQFDELIEEYLKKIENRRKLLNLIDPPFDHIKSFIQRTLRTYLKYDYKKVILDLVKEGYKSDDVEELSSKYERQFTQNIKEEREFNVLNLSNGLLVAKYYDHYMFFVLLSNVKGGHVVTRDYNQGLEEVKKIIFEELNQTVNKFKI